MIFKNYSLNSTKKKIFLLSVPIFFSNLAIPLVGVVDTGLILRPEISSNGNQFRDEYSHSEHSVPHSEKMSRIIPDIHLFYDFPHPNV